jgi:hypothetical protein
MSKLLIALSLYLGLGFFFVINALSIVRGAPIFTAIGKAFVALVLFALLGTIAGLLTRVNDVAPEKAEEAVEVPSAQEA